MILSSLNSPLRIQGDTLGSPMTLTLPGLGRDMALRYRCGEKVGMIADSGKHAQVTWTPPMALAEAYPNRERIPVQLILDAYAGSELIDSRETQVLLRLPEEISPTLTLEVLPETGSSFLQGGRARVTVTAAGTLGAALADCTVRCGGLIGQGQQLAFDLPQAGEIFVTAQVTDSRGRTAQAAAAITVQPGGTESETPLLDLNPAGRALGVGCRGDRANTLSMGLALNMGGKALTGLPYAAAPEDALPLGQAAASFLGLRKLWENPTPQAEFPAQTLAVSGTLLLIEAAEQAGSTGRVWEIAGAAGTIRVCSGGTTAARSLRQTEAGLEFGTAAPGDGWAIPLAVYALRGGVTA